MIKNRSLSGWLTISLFNLVLVAVLGLLLRYKILYSLPFINQQFLLHSHSHFAFTGWVTQTLMVLMMHYLSLKGNNLMIRKYPLLLYANLIAAYGMLFSFVVQGYAPVSIFFSTLSVLISWVFAVYYWKDLNTLNESRVSHLWFKAAIVFSVISSLGPFQLAYIMANNITDQSLYLTSIYFFLHFQYNGWFFFAGMGLLNTKFEKILPPAKNLYYGFLLFCAACIPAYLLSILWLDFSRLVFALIAAAVVAQLAGWLLILKVLVDYKKLIINSLSKFGRILLLLSAIAFSIKLLLQSGSIHPTLSHLSYGFRPIIIGYLHLVLLAVTSIFIIGYMISFEMIAITRRLIIGAVIFVAGIILNELLLMVQGVGALTYTIIPHINLMLLVAAVILVTGPAIMVSSCMKDHTPPTI
jgi:hypothetical protein